MTLDRYARGRSASRSGTGLLPRECMVDRDAGSLIPRSHAMSLVH